MEEYASQFITDRASEDVFRAMQKGGRFELEKHDGTNKNNLLIEERFCMLEINFECVGSGNGKYSTIM